ncbi:bacteriocin biosynthesis protein SagD [Halorubrum ezzemoulense]|uniref:Bacteriocin biosynthesis protein SagD n=1 Tax=Halorubrum ezzemoulense TaxID=337243 RepID=A0A256J0J1_HALEZ|nr:MULTISPECIES: YcaO-like family protein [Halorubrum]MDB2224194.1 YcaO-like family protein [Halorubrum ezzemoulense]MDB9235346.1 YcaO-like family protein [Halorubrum ezzemoulense]OYR60027.1 bacteriocin biosynthesis protein SagD [Halorubrum ezzemoulense]OYR62330.1 bacteriocin biosynthesis protein SagD [Halorubrum ezzemoulense]TKX38457.1 bacteriocin biosynthesis protein SagD [Halorubrum sp. CGM5_25_10-8B]
MDIGLVGDGPAVEAAEAALGDVDVNAMPVEADLLDGFDAAVVVDTAGSATFGAADDMLDRWVAVEVGGLGGVPLADLDAAVTVFDDACYDCLRARVESGGAEPADAPTGRRSAVRYAGAVAGRRTIRLLAGDPVADTVVEVPGGERTLLPVPGCGCGDGPGDALPRDHADRGLDEAIDRAERAVDRRIGALAEVGEQESFPVPYYVARVADTTPFSDADAADFGGGAAADWDAAFMKALGEGLERYAAGVYREASFTRAPAANVPNPVTPDAFVRPDGAEAYDRDDRLPWVRGERLGTGEPASLPAEFVHFPPPERRYRPPITTGLGLGSSGPDAALSGLYEAIERDATMTSWYSTTEPLGLDVDDPGFAELEKRARAESLSVTPLLVTTDVDVPVVAVGVSREGDWPRFAAGSGADLDPAAAARSALAEALQNWTELRSMGREAADEQGAAIGHHADLPGETAAFFDPDASVSAEGLGEPELTGEAELSAVVDRVEAVGLDPYVARVTTRDLAAVGFEAARVLVPGAQPLFTGDPFFGDRAREVPRSMGFEPALDRPYHPFP